MIQRASEVVERLGSVLVLNFFEYPRARVAFSSF